MIQESIQNIDFFEKHIDSLSILLTEDDWKDIRNNARNSVFFDRYALKKSVIEDKKYVKNQKKVLREEFENIITGI